jgi:predicted ester cyclase
MAAEGERAAVRWTVRGTHQGGFMSLPPTGKEVRLSGITMYRLSGGKIAEGRSNFDQLGVLQQLGVIPSPGQAGR